jgi:hypothetical protein
MIIWLVAATDDQGIADALAQGWVRLAARRFVTPGRHDVRVIRSMADLIAGDTPVVRMLKGSDYESGPAKGPDVDPLAWARWEREKPEFDKFVATGRGWWVDASFVEESAAVTEPVEAAAGF